jgi:hypothetical protein
MFVVEVLKDGNLLAAGQPTPPSPGIYWSSFMIASLIRPRLGGKCLLILEK